MITNKSLPQMRGAGSFRRLLGVRASSTQPAELTRHHYQIRGKRVKGERIPGKERRSLPWASIEAVDGGAGVIPTVAPDHDQGSARIVVVCNAASARGANVAHIGVLPLFGP